MDRAIPFFKLKDDSRLTPLGKWTEVTPGGSASTRFRQLLERHPLRQQPHGGQPPPKEQVAANPELLRPGHEVRAGVTGWWQIQGWSDVTAEVAMQVDKFDTQNWSPY